MPNIPYFSLGKHSFEKNAGYKSTVHALAELIDNSVEANAKSVVILLMIDFEKRLQKIAVADDGEGMSPEELQKAVCEKSGSHLNRQDGETDKGAKRYGKYGVGLPKASISQCDVFSVWSWIKGNSKNAYRNGVNTQDEDWLKAGAQIGTSIEEAVPQPWIKAASLANATSGTFVLWEALNGLTWQRARWGDNSGLIPNLQFSVGRAYRYLIAGDDPALSIKIVVISETYKIEETVPIEPNDPLYITPGCKVPRETLADGTLWPEDDPLFDDLTGKDNHIDVKVPTADGPKEVRVTWKRSAARKNTFSRLDGRNAGSLPHGKHAAKNVGLSLLREGREVDLSLVLANPSEPRERYFGVEFNFPHELDAVLGMTNNKQNYTRLEQVLKAGAGDYQTDNESPTQCLERIRKEDSRLAVCLQIAWKIEEVWNATKRFHLNVREPEVTKTGNEGPVETTPESPEQKAEAVATTVDNAGATKVPRTNEEKQKLKQQAIKELTDGNVPKHEAEEIAERVIEHGFTYAIAKVGNLGLPFFNVGSVVDAKLIELNTDHPVYPYLLDAIEKSPSSDPDVLKKRLENARTAMFLVLEAWAKIESDTRQMNPQQYRIYQGIRSDWGRTLSSFIDGMNLASGETS